MLTLTIDENVLNVYYIDILSELFITEKEKLAQHLVDRADAYYIEDSDVESAILDYHFYTDLLGQLEFHRKELEKKNEK